MNSSRIRSLTAAALLLSTVGLTGYARAATEPIPHVTSNSASSEVVDVAVRSVLKGYLDALNRGDYAQAASYWSASANVKPAELKVDGVSDWFFVSSEMIRSTGTTATVQLNFTVKVAPGAKATYTEGRNVRYVKLSREPGGWKIQSITTSP